MTQASITYAPPNTSLPVQYAHMIEYFSKGIDEQGPFYKVLYYIRNWADADLFVNSLLGYTSITGSTTSGTVLKRGPHQHPLSTNLFCRRATATGLGTPVLGAQGYPNYSGGARVEAEYRSVVSVGFDYSANPDGSIDPGTPVVWCTQELEFATETYLIPNTMMVFVATGLPTNQPFRMYVPITNLVLTFHKLPYIPMVAVRALRCRVNSVTFLGAAAGCVLFRTGNCVREYNEDGSVVQKVKLVFAERDATQQWNWLPDPADLTWKAVRGPLAAGSPAPYPTADLSPLVQF